MARSGKGRQRQERLSKRERARSLKYLFAFEARGIQEFVLESDELREMVGGSLVVEGVTGTLLDEALRGLGIGAASTQELVRAAGRGQIGLESEEDARRLAGIWPVAVDRFSGGLEVLQALVRVRDGNWAAAFGEARERLEGERQRVEARLPEAGPLVARAPGTGEPACASVRKESRRVLIGRASMRRRALFDSEKARRELEDRFTPRTWGKVEWPIEMREVAGGGGEEGSRYLAVVHADGNGFGSLFRRLWEHFDQAGRGAEAGAFAMTFTTGLQEVARDALVDALEHAIGEPPGGRVPARPIVAGGDDLTLTIRADMAPEFVARYLEDFEAYGARLLEREDVRPLVEAGALPAALTASAGVAFVKENYPFSHGYELAESLCAHAKRCGRQASGEGEVRPSAIACHRVTTALSGRYERILELELRDPDKRALSAAPYGVGRHADALPGFRDLQELARVLQDCAPRGSVRELCGTLRLSPARAEAQLGRLKRIADRQGRDRGEAIKNALQAVTGGGLWRELKGGAEATPLLDAHTLRVFLGDDKSAAPAPAEVVR